MLTRRSTHSLPALGLFLLALPILGASGGSQAQAGIRVTQARIGCLDIQRSGNLTRLVQRACNGKTSCSYKAPTPQEYQRAGVRALTRSFCTQAMEIRYHCGDGRAKRANVPGDAWKRAPARLACPATGRSARAARVIRRSNSGRRRTATRRRSPSRRTTVRRTTSSAATRRRAAASRGTRRPRTRASARTASGIVVTMARIGCLDIQRTGNLTRFVARSCNGKAACTYKAPTEREYRALGVRASTRSFCTQGMEISYHCGDRSTKKAVVPGDAWNHPPARLFCDARVAPKGSRAKNPNLVPVLQGILSRYERCIIEKYETSKTAHLQHRDRDTCADGRSCTMTSRRNAWNRLRQLAADGDPTRFEEILKSAVLGDCMECRDHGKWHTKHTHCTMKCGGNNGLIEGPCFEGCKAFVDINHFLRDVAAELKKHAALFVGNFTGEGSNYVANMEKNESFGLTVATNRSLVTPTDSEHCDPSGKGIFIAPSDPNLLDWTPTNAPKWKSLLTGYMPPSPPSKRSYDPRGLRNIGANEGRLRADLRAVAKRADPEYALCLAAEAFVRGKEADGNALADLAVSGSRSFAKFKARQPRAASVARCAGARPGARGKPAATVRREVDKALRRAYRVAQVLRAGGWPAACPERNALGYIAVSGEDDQPHRPTNVPSAEFAQHDLSVSVGGIKVDTRYIIAQRTADARSPSCRDQGLKLLAEPRPTLARNAEVILYVHGMDSRLEEAMDLIHSLHELGKVRGKNYTVISVDLPTSGYATKLDYNKISPLSALGQATGGLLGTGIGFRPNKYNAPVVKFIADFVVSFINTLSRKLPGLPNQVKAVVGGSLGGNTTMRLGRPRSDARWVKNVIPWSPAGMWGSKADNDIEHVALATPWSFAGGDPAYKGERDWSRRGFFYGGFDWQSKVLYIINITKPQAEEWYGDWWQCKKPSERYARVDRYETYNENFRRWHWRLAAEQLMFSHTIKERGVPLYHGNTIRTLLMCGIQDTGGGLCEATRKVAADMKYTPGYALYLKTTGHSIHNERPNFLARHVANFIASPTRGISMDLDVTRAGGALKSMRAASPVACRDACRGNRSCRAYNYRRPATLRDKGFCTLLRTAGRQKVDVNAVSGKK